MASDSIVSVLIITFNHSKYIEQAVESALAQTYRNLEVVVADDGSTDGAHEILRGLASRHPSRLRLILGPHVGVCASANRGLRACNGDLITLLDGDDLYEPEKVQKQVDWFSASPSRVMCGHAVLRFGTTTPSVFGLHQPATGAGPRRFLRSGSPFPTVSVMVRRSSIPSSGFDERLAIAPDFKFLIDCLVGGGQFGYIPGALARYRVHAASATATRQQAMWSDAFAAYAYYESAHPEFAADCRIGRARLFVRRGVEQAIAGQWDRALADFRAAAAIDPIAASKSFPLRLLGRLPMRLRDGLLRLRLGRKW